MSKKVLFTGHAGFVGQHCLEYWLEKTDWKFFCFQSLRHTEYVKHHSDPRVLTFRHDLALPIDSQLQSLMTESVMQPLTGFMHYFGPSYIINMASDSGVERSVTDPVPCLSNNYNLMVNMLEYARKCNGLRLFIHISTDEVYGEAPEGGHKEWAPIMPSNPYAASKAAQEALAIAYWRTYKLPIVIVNIMNVIGERQSSEKFLPKIIQKIKKGEEMPIYAENEESIGSRMYIHAKNIADAIMFLANRQPAIYDQAERPDRYNICGGTEINNLEMAKLVANIMGKDLKYKIVPACIGYNKRHMLDGIKLRSLGWEAPIAFEESLERIVHWTLNH